MFLVNGENLKINVTTAKQMLQGINYPLERTQTRGSHSSSSSSNAAEVIQRFNFGNITRKPAPVSSQRCAAIGYRIGGSYRVQAADG